MKNRQGFVEPFGVNPANLPNPAFVVREVAEVARGIARVGNGHIA